MGFDGVLGGAEEGLDAQVLLDPFEEQLDAPAIARRQTSISRKLSRWVSWAKARQRNWPRQVKDLT